MAWLRLDAGIPNLIVHRLHVSITSSRGFLSNAWQHEVAYKSDLSPPRTAKKLHNEIAGAKSHLVTAGSS